MKRYDMKERTSDGKQKSIPRQAQQSLAVGGAYVSSGGCGEAERISQPVPL